MDAEEDRAIEDNDAVDDLLTEHDEGDPPFQFIDHQKHDAFMYRRPEILNIDDSELAFFSLFFTDKLVGDMVEYTNKYADAQITSNKMKNPSKDGRDWSPVSHHELLRFFAILIYRGLFPSPRIQDYWSKDPRMPQHADFGMSLFRFQQIKRYFKACDSVKEANAREAGKSVYYDKVRPLLDGFVETSQKYYMPSRDVSIDEMIVRFGGRSTHTVKIRSKPVPVGYKILALCDGGYVYAVLPEARGKSNRELDVPHRWVIKDRDMEEKGVKIPRLTTIARKVRFLIEQLPDSSIYKFHLYMDNYFNSVPLFEYLRLHGIGACGTARVHKNGPLRLLYPLKMNTKLERDTFRIFHNGKVAAHFWVDSNAVVALSTIHSASTTNGLVTKLRKRPRDTNSKGAKSLDKIWGRDRRGNPVYVKELPMPRAIDDYNQHMGGVDIADQLRQYYTVQMRSLRNWYPLFLWLLDSSIINAYILRCLHTTIKNKDSHRLFRMNLYDQLLDKAKRFKEEELQAAEAMPTTRSLTKRAARKLERPTKRAEYITPNCRKVPLSNMRFVGQHLPERAANRQHCYWCRIQATKTRAGQTNTMCSQCKIFLCTFPCFKDYHAAETR